MDEFAHNEITLIGLGTTLTYQTGSCLMSAVTRRALRVYTALVELRNSNEDILDALIPFLEPILEAMNGKVFDPEIFAIAVKKVLRWRFTKDIANNFVPRLERKGYLKRQQTKYIVEYLPPDDSKLTACL